MHIPIRGYFYYMRVCVCVCVSRSVVSNSLRPHGRQPGQAPLSMEFSRPEYWSGLPCPSPGDLPDPGVGCWPPASQADSLFELQGSPVRLTAHTFIFQSFYDLMVFFQLQFSIVRFH